MKTKSIHLLIVSLAILTALAVSCAEEEDDIYEMVSDTVVGKYEYKSVTIQGYSLDLNGDGIASDDVMAEFEGKTMNMDWLWRRPLKVSPYDPFWGGRQRVNVEIPKQYINYDKTTGEYVTDVMYGNSMILSFSWWIDESGKIYTEGEKRGEDEDLYKEDDRIIERVDCKNSNNIAKELTFDQKGGIKALVESSYYDFATDKLLTVPVLFEYERVSYSLD